MRQDPAHLSLQEFTGALEQCLEQTFDEPVRLEEADVSVPLPPVLETGYQLFSTTITGKPCLLMTVRGKPHIPAELALHVSLMRSAVDAVVIFVAPALSAKQALSLIKEGVSFAVPEHVPHIPELGSDLRTYGGAPMPAETDDSFITDQQWVFPYRPPPQ